MINLFIIISFVIWLFSLRILAKKLNPDIERLLQEKQFWVPYLLFYLGNVLFVFTFVWYLQNQGGRLLKQFSSNTAHHFLFFKGFEAARREPIVLASESNPQMAVYPLLKGGLSFSLAATNKRYEMAASNLATPLFISTDTAKPIKDKTWILQRSREQPIPAENSGQIIITSSHYTQTDTIGYFIQNTRPATQQYQLRFIYQGRQDTLSETLAYGARLSTLLQNTKLPLPARLVESAGFIMLLKDTVSYLSKNNKTVSLKWYGGTPPFLSYWQQKSAPNEPDAIVIKAAGHSHNVWPKNNYQVKKQLPAGTAFYLGIDPAGASKTNKQPVFTLAPNATGTATIELVQPLIYSLPATSNPYLNNRDSTSLFITSNAQGLWKKTSIVAGFILPPSNIEGGDSNRNYLFGLLNYKPGLPGSPLEAVFIDRAAQRHPAHEKEVKLPSNGIYWKFELRDQWSSWGKLDYLFFIGYILLGGILLIIFLWQWRPPDSNSNSSLAYRGHPIILWAMVTFVALLYSFRWVLNWRLYSFPPTENISYDTYSTYFLHPGNNWVTPLTLLAPLVLVIVFLLINKSLIKRTRLGVLFSPERYKWRLGLLLLGTICMVILPVVLYFILPSLEWRRYCTCLFLAGVLISLLYFPNSRSVTHYMASSVTIRKYRLGVLFTFLLYLCFAFTGIFILDRGLGINLFMALAITFLITLFIIPNNGYKRLTWFLAPALALLIVFAFMCLNTHERIDDPVDLSVQQSRVLSFFDNTDKAAVEAALNNSESTLSLGHLQRAHENQYFMEQYAGLARPMNINSRLLPHSSFGSSYNTQLSDTLPVRFIIAEHGLLPIIFFSLFLVCILYLIVRNIIFTETSNPYNKTNLAGFIIVLLLTVFSILIVFINLNLVPFSGLNYLTFSLNDRSFSSSLVFLLLAVAAFGIRYQAQSFEMTVKSQAMGLLRFLVAVLILLTPFFAFWIAKTLSRSNVQPYNLVSLKDEIRSQVKLVNTHLTNYCGDTITDASRKRQYQDSISRIDINHFLQSFAKHPSFTAYMASDTPISYARSYLNDFLSSNHNKWNPLNLVYLARRKDDKYELVANDDFFKKQPMSLKEPEMLPPIFTWSSNSNNHYSFLVNSSITVNEKDILEKTTSAGPVRLLSLPATAFRKTGQPADISTITIAGSASGYSFSSLVTQENAIKRINGNDLARMLPTDNLVAKGYWINGALQYLYPSDSSNTWFYLMAQNIKAMKSTGPIHLSLDIDLHKELERIWSNAADSSLACVSVVDGEGRVRAFPQNKQQGTDTSFHLNYNYTPSQTDFNLLVYFMPAATQRAMLQNRNFIAADKPGSTIKPFTTASVIAGANVSWDQLSLSENGELADEITVKLLGDGSRYVRAFAGQEAGTVYMDQYDSLSAPEFLSQSKNLYHHVITFLGSFKEMKIYHSPLGEGKGLLTQKMDNQVHWKDFPRLRIGHRLYRLDPGEWPSANDSSYFGDRLAIMPNQLRYNYGLLLTANPSGADIKEWRRRNLGDSLLISNDSLTLYPDLVFPEYAWFNEEDRRTSRDRPDFRNALFNTSVGAIVYNIPPLVQAKMAINMARTNQHIKLSFVERSGKSDSLLSFKLGDTYGGKITDFRSRLAQTVMEGMKRSNESGTAREILGRQWPERDTLIEKSGLFLYTKTGTAVERENNDLLRRKTLLVIIANKDLHSATQTGNPYYQDLKVISLYFQVRNHRGAQWSPEAVGRIRKSISTTLRSSSIKKYFQPK